MKKNKTLGWVQVDPDRLELEGHVPIRRGGNVLRKRSRLHPFVLRKIERKIARENLESLIRPAEKDITPSSQPAMKMCLDMGAGIALVGVLVGGAAALYAREGNKLNRQAQAKTGCQKLVGAERCGKSIIRAALLQDKKGRELIRYWCEGGHAITRYVK